MTNTTAIRLGDRFWSKVDVRGEHDCWPWIARRHHTGYSSGYGTFLLEGKKQIPHRLVAGLKAGDPGCAFRRCGSPDCVNPSHIYVATRTKGASSKLSQEQADAIRTRGDAGEPHGNIAADYNVSRSMISRIIRGERWAKHTTTTTTTADAQNNTDDHAALTAKLHRRQTERRQTERPTCPQCGHICPQCT